MLSPEEMFQKVWDHFVIGDGKPSVNKPEAHRYRSLYKDGFGNRCAIGLFVPDDVYQPTFEDADALQVLNASGVIPNQINRHFAALILALQKAHDVSVFFGDDPALFKETMKDYLEKIARGFDIQFTRHRPQK
jgi:hypothetical protein